MHDMPAVPSAGDALREEALLKRAERALRRLYGERDDFAVIMADVMAVAQAARAARPAALQALDAARLGQPRWFLRPGRPAYCTYIDRFSGTLANCVSRIPYLKALGVGLLHPLPLLKPREGDSDGGFAVADYLSVDPKLGDFNDLKALAAALRDNDMSLVLDVVCNHTAREHAWARGWVAGDPAYADFYIRLNTEAEVEAWSAPLGQVFPDTAPGNFTYDAEAGGWVWTTFYPFQWDLNYANPRVFIAMLSVLFELANAGVEGFRLDSAAYLWKIKGTACRNLPQAHDLLQAFRSLLSVVAPGVFLLAEAIEGLDEVLGYFGEDAGEIECDLAYNNTAMTALWGAVAETDAGVMRAALEMTACKPPHGVWLNYARCHDDIIWQALAGWVAQDRLHAWSDYYACDGRGLAFQAPGDLAPSTCGMAASLCRGGDLMLERLKMVYSVIYAMDGVPMLYMGDEIALENDLSFLSNPALAPERRWLHRPLMDWKMADKRDRRGSAAAAMFGHIQALNAAQVAAPGWTDAAPAKPLAGLPAALLAFERQLPKGRFVCLANLGDAALDLPADMCGRDLISGESLNRVGPCRAIWRLM